MSCRAPEKACDRNGTGVLSNIGHQKGVRVECILSSS